MSLLRKSLLASPVLGCLALMLVLSLEPAKAEDYQAIDKHALNAPKDAEASIESLVAYLTEPARNERERLRAIFRWITANIDYDTEGFWEAAAERKEEVTVEKILERRSAICDGYTLLTKSMVSRATTAGIEISEVKGFAKGYGYRAGADFEGSNHAWNAFQLDGKWYFMDCTWGAGLPNEKGEFVRKLEDYYFLTPPEELKYTHFPEDPSWQRIERPVSKQEFIEIAYLWPSYFKYGMKLDSHPGSIIETGSGIEITLYAPDSVLLEADLLGGQGRPLDQQYTFVRKDSSLYRINSIFPSAGEYYLRIYTRLKDEEGAFRETLNYKVLAGRGENDPQAGFPLAYEPFLLHGAYLFTPLSRSLEPGKKHAFRLKVPQAKAVAVVIGEDWHRLGKDGDNFQGEVEIAQGTAVEIYARFEGSLSFDCLLEYSAP